MPRKSKSYDGQIRYAHKASDALPSSPPENDKGQTPTADKANASAPLSFQQSGEGHMSSASTASSGVPSPPLDIEQLVDGIRYWHRQRVYAMEQRKRADLSLLAFLRSALGWSKALPDAERAKIAKQAMALVALCEAEANGKEVDTSEPAYVEWRDIIAASLAARAPFDAIESRAVKQMGKLAHELPIYEWAAPIRGFGDVSLAVIVAEAGDLSNYATHSKLWKRMGVAVMGDVRQGGLAKSASKEAWIAHGYNRQRRSRLWNIGDALIKAQVRKKLDENGEDKGQRVSLGDYGEIYLYRKSWELAGDPDMQPIKVHRRAQRYMEKKLLRDLWRAWTNERKAASGLPSVAEFVVPSARRDELEATLLLPQEADASVPPTHRNEEMAATALPTLADLRRAISSTQKAEGQTRGAQRGRCPSAFRLPQLNSRPMLPCMKAPMTACLLFNTNEQRALLCVHKPRLGCPLLTKTKGKASETLLIM